MKNADVGFSIDENTTYAEVILCCICWYLFEILKLVSAEINLVLFF